MSSAPRVDWLPQRAHGLPGRLGLTCAPGGWRLGAYPDDAAQLDEDLRALARVHGATALVTLLEEPEIERRVAPDFPERARRAGLELVSFPIPDGWVPESLEATSQLVASIVDRLLTGQTIVVHCLAGLGRTGTIASCCLVACGRPPADAIRAVRAARPGSLQNSAQEAFVASFAAAWASRQAGLRA